jgi:hypothetical protein
VVADETQRRSDVRILDGEHLGGAFRDQALRGDEHRRRRRLLSCHHPIEHHGGLEADYLSIEDHTGKRDVRQLAKHLVLVDANHRDLIGHAQLDRTTTFESLAGAGVVARHEADRLGQSRQPADQLWLVFRPMLLVFPRGIVGGWMRVLEYVTGKPGAGDGHFKSGPPAIRPLGAVVTAEGKLAETTLEQMLGRQTAHGQFVRAQGRHLQIRKPAEEVDRWNLLALDRRSERPVLDACYDTVALPAMEPLWYLSAGISFLKIDRPRAVNPHEFRDAHEPQPLTRRGLGQADRRSSAPGQPAAQQRADARWFHPARARPGAAGDGRPDPPRRLPRRGG